MTIPSTFLTDLLLASTPDKVMHFAFRMVRSVTLRERMNLLVMIDRGVYFVICMVRSVTLRENVKFLVMI